MYDHCPHGQHDHRRDLHLTYGEDIVYNTQFKTNKWSLLVKQGHNIYCTMYIVNV